MNADLTMDASAAAPLGWSEQDGRKYLALALFIGAAIRFYLLWRYYCINSDGVIYIEAARDFFRGDIWAGLASVYPPGYPLLIAAAHVLIPDWELAGQLLSVVFGVGMLLPLYWLLRDIFDHRVAAIACLLASLSPFLARYSVQVRTESSYLFFVILALWLLARGIERGRRGDFFSGGLAAGFAYLVRPEGIGLLLIIPAVLVFRRLLQRDGGGSVGVRNSGLLLAGFLVLALPYIAYLSVDTGRWGAISRKAGVTLSINLQTAGILDAGDADTEVESGNQDFLNLIRRHPFQYVIKVVTDLPRAVGTFFEVLHFSYVPFLLIGLYLAYRGSAWRGPEQLLMGFVLFYLVGLTMILVRRRYSLQLVPVSLGWCAVGALWAWQRCKRRLSPRLANLAIALIGVSFLAATLPKTLSPVSPEKAYVRDAGRYLGTLNPDGKLKLAVMDNRIPFYAGAQTLSLGDVKESALGDYLRQHKPDYLASDARLWQRRFPNTPLRAEAVGMSFDREFVGTRKDRVLVFKRN